MKDCITRKLNVADCQYVSQGQAMIGQIINRSILELLLLFCG